MLETFWIPLIPPFFIGLLLSWTMENLLQPRPQAPWKRPLAANLTHIGVWTLAFALELALFRRPYFAVANVLAIQMLLVLVSRAKYQALQEPFVYPDFEYFTDAIKHPRLYLPFFGWKNALASGGGYGLALWAGLTFEDSVTAGAGVWLVSFADLPQESVFDVTAPVVPFYMHTATLAASGLLLVILMARKLSVEFNAGGDLQKLGLIGALCAYRRAELKPVAAELQMSAPFSSLPKKVNASAALPDLITIQSESFFDVRRAFPLVKQDVLRAFDQLRAEAISFGELDVAARGANTVRSEFAFLTGTDADSLGIHRYNPYRRLAQQGVPTLASYLRTLGYRTICVHPYHGSFYRRDVVIPLLGFDEFIDLSSFSDAERVGNYVGDQALADYVCSVLDEHDDRPIYIHVITMENHGPLHLERVDEHGVGKVLNDAMPNGCSELVAYALHLKNADAMFDQLKNKLLDRTRPAGMCIFGDHVPIMPTVYKNLGEVSGTSDYVLWSSEEIGQYPEAKRSISDLAGLMLKNLVFKPQVFEKKQQQKRA